MERIGEYLISRLVGEGGMGKVFEAQERLSKRRVALKVLRPELARSDKGRQLFLNEMTILASLDHPNVVRCLACTEVDGELVMVLEYLQGKTLREVLVEQGRLPWPQAVEIVDQIAAGLGAAHGQDPPIIHRDLKPENIILMPDGQIKVMDFGIAKVLEALSHHTTHSVGTLKYMSPEQIDALGVDARSDLYSLGLVFYELLSGRTPFESESPRELLNQQCTEPPPELDDEVRRGLPNGVHRLVFGLLHKRPGDRPPSAGHVRSALEPFGSAAVAEQAPARSTEGLHQPWRDSIPPASAPPAGRRSSDTIGLVEKAGASQNEIPTRLAVALIFVLCGVVGAVTFWARTATGAENTLPSASGARAATR